MKPSGSKTRRGAARRAQARRGETSRLVRVTTCVDVEVWREMGVLAAQTGATKAHYLRDAMQMWSDRRAARRRA